MFKGASSSVARKRRHQRIRKRLAGTSERPRLCVFRSLTHIYAQVVDDDKGHTLVSASTMDPELKTKSGTKSEQAKAVGTAIAERAKAAGITRVVFDRGGYLYHGRVQHLADAARAAGLEF
jgi:large subunit ribosomal protein L18